VSQNFEFPKDKEIEKEIVPLLSNLIKIDTTNPPGNELKAAEYIYDILNKEGIDVEILKSSDTRGNVIARIKGKSPGKKIALMGHLDVVPADPKDWSVDPFGGVVKDGYVWGRGALDCKGLVAQQVWTMIQLAREGFKPEKGELIFIGEADEENGAEYGAKWLIKNYPELTRIDYLITEGGGFASRITGKNKYTMEVAQKRPFWVKLRLKGAPGHGSIPSLEDNVIVKTARIIEKIHEYKTPTEINPVVKIFLKEFLEGNKVLSKLAASKKVIEKMLKILARKDPSTATFIHSMLHDTITPTMMKSGYKENVIPGDAEVVLDARLLPGKTFDDLLNHLKKALGNDFEEIEYELLMGDVFTKITNFENNQFVSAIEKALKYVDPEGVVVPFMISGGTDSRFFREKGVQAIGFQPIPPGSMSLKEIAKLVHGINERIPIDTLVFGAKFFYALSKVSLETTNIN